MKADKFLKFFLLIAALFSFLAYCHDLSREFIFSEFDDVGHYYVCSKLLSEKYDVYKGSTEATSRADEIFKEMSTAKNQYYKPTHSIGFFLLFLPFSQFTYHKAAVAWVLLSNVLFAAGVFMLLMCFSKMSLARFCTSIFLVFSMWPLREGGHFGQASIVIVFLFAAALVALRKRNDLALGLCLALGVTVKEIFAGAFIFLLWQRNWRAIIWAVVSLALIKIASITVFGFNAEISYWQAQYGYWISGFTRGTMSISFSETARRVFSGIITEKAIATVVLAIDAVLFVLLLKWSGIKSRTANFHKLALGFSLFLLFSMLVSPWLRETHLVILTIPLLVIWLTLYESGNTGCYVLFAVGYLIIALRYSIFSFPYFQSGFLAIFDSAKVFGCLILFYLCAKLLKEDLVYGD